MATLTAQNPNLLDRAQALDPNGQVATVVEMMHEVNEVIGDVTFIEGNLETGHKTVVRAGLPSVTWRRIYGRVVPDKSKRASITDTCGVLEAYNEIDAELVDLASNGQEFRLSEAQAQIEAMTQELANTIFYGNTDTDPEKFDGLAPRYNSLSAENADNIVVGGSADTDNASIWLVCWGPQSCHGIIPKGSTAGLTVSDKGRVTSETGGGSPDTSGLMEVYRMHFKLKAGLTLKDWRYVVRIPNIERSALKADASSGPNLPELMFEAMERIPSMGNTRPVFYMDRKVRTIFRQQLAAATKQSTLTYENVGGHRAVMFNEIPIRRCDALAVNEALVT